MVTLTIRKAGQVVATEQYQDEAAAWDRRDQLLDAGCQVEMQGVAFYGWCEDGGEEAARPLGRWGAPVDNGW